MEAGKINYPTALPWHESQEAFFNMNLNEVAPSTKSATGLFSTIAKALGNPHMGGWTSVPKGQTFAAIVLALRPEVCVEIGVWEGKGTIAIALALKEVGRGVVHAIDPWSAQASVEGQTHPGDIEHWGKADHEAAYNKFLVNLSEYNVRDFVRVVRSKSDVAEVPSNIGFISVDGNHGDASITDVKRFAPKVRHGGLCYMDDLDWSTGSVRRAEAQLKSMGFIELYKIENGAMFQRLSQ